MRGGAVETFDCRHLTAGRFPDLNAGDWNDERYDVLVAWPPQREAPEHFSLVGRVSRLGQARRYWFDLDRQQRTQEDWNLLYVAMTRARRVLIVSGVEQRRSVGDSWYRRLEAATRFPADSYQFHFRVPQVPSHFGGDLA